jgi:hypothetical protein
MTDSYDGPEHIDFGINPEPDASSSGTSPPPAIPVPTRKTPLQNEIDLKVQDANNKVTAADRALVAQMSDPTYGSHRHDLTPPQAALIVTEYNRHNRDLQIGKVRFLGSAMGRGEWKWNHQGIAFYDDGMLGDGQHRCYACVLANVTIPIQITSNLSKNAIDTVDNQSIRNAGDACQLLGIKDPKLKARVMATVAEYEEDLANERTSGARLTVVQVEKLVVAYDEQLDAAIALARDIISKLATPHQSEWEVASCSLGLLRGGYPPSRIAQYTLAVNMGMGDYADCPTVDLAKQLERAKNGESRKWRLSGRQKMALFYRGAALFVERKSIAKLKWDSTKEKLPSPMYPEGAVFAAE